MPYPSVAFGFPLMILGMRKLRPVMEKSSPPNRKVVCSPMRLIGCRYQFPEYLKVTMQWMYFPLAYEFPLLACASASQLPTGKIEITGVRLQAPLSSRPTRIPSRRPSYPFAQRLGKPGNPGVLSQNRQAACLFLAVWEGVGMLASRCDLQYRRLHLKSGGQYSTG